MDKNLGVSFSLSVLTVLFFAVVLYQPDTPSSEARSEPRAAVSTETENPAPPSRPTEPTVADLRPIEVRPGAVPRPSPVVEPAPRREVAATRPIVAVSRPLETSALRVLPASVSEPTAPTRMAGEARPPRGPKAVPTPVAAPKKPARPGGTAPARPAPAKDPVREPKGTFTRVRRGEKLEDVAFRVYGSDEAAQTLWDANRDLLDAREAPLKEGALLRTP